MYPSVKILNSKKQHIPFSVTIMFKQMHFFLWYVVINMAYVVMYLTNVSVYEDYWWKRQKCFLTEIPVNCQVLY